MDSVLAISRRGFLKTAGMAAAAAMIGGGMLVPAPSRAAALDFVGQRQSSVYEADAKVYKIRKSQDNPMIKKIYGKEGFLSEGPLGHTSHQLLHTYYYDRSAGVKALKAKGVQLKV
ncbi:ferredoxin hydrogenase small subunit [Paucidesulfovibrio gracilis DSM 16080]|uniref:Ferredoxin hydrogenase small subunit n=1 Tax=Paucidesulfovibrio gracilis DSM 16080 TaxID=1121449 RepID=A0A1T4WXL9_9BACT|nr:iron hydrogenase small subunit [Paucidesulfovibrio gracilis]SKA82113.1 ferredoxin hydrogenase small subunit [Paucidesulfovibrio gracilis DSM 16080]